LPSLVTALQRLSSLSLSGLLSLFTACYRLPSIFTACHRLLPLFNACHLSLPLAIHFYRLPSLSLSGLLSLFTACYRLPSILPLAIAGIGTVSLLRFYSI
jgi:hypothetical protein